MRKKKKKPRQEKGPFTFIDGKKVYMKDMIWEDAHGRKIPHGYEVGYKNGDGSDNRRDNLILVKKK